MVVCGFSAGERKIVLNIFLELKLKDLPVVFTTATDWDQLMKTLVLRDHKSGLNPDSEREEACDLAPAIIMSGLTEKELHKTMSAYKKRKLPKALWATLTPTSENWTLQALVSELMNERLHFENPPEDN
jgi:hypothetical protein